MSVGDGLSNYWAVTRLGVALPKHYEGGMRAHGRAGWEHGDRSAMRPMIKDTVRFKLGSIERFEEKWFWFLCDTTKTT